MQVLSLGMNGLLRGSCFKLFRKGWKKIESLDLSKNHLSGELPAPIGKLCNLKYLDLSSNNLEGTLPESLEGIENYLSTSPLPSLHYLELSHNQLHGKLPDWLGQLANLDHLGLAFNCFQGPIPASLWSFLHLTGLALKGNKLNGTLSDSLGQLSELISFDVSFNYLTGILTESHFSKLTKLEFLYLSSNLFTLNVSSNWVPPFQLWDIFMSKFHFGPSFQAWLKSQKKVENLEISYASISGSIPSWFWEISSNLLLLNVSFNQLHGQLPNQLNLAPLARIDLSSNLFEGPIPLPVGQIAMLDLSNNTFSGPIPRNIGASMSELFFLSLSSNRIAEDIPTSIGNMSSIEVFDFSGNNLTGRIPPTIGNCSSLEILDLRNNN